jgi:hypothetical protein
MTRRDRISLLPFKASVYRFSRWLSTLILSPLGYSYLPFFPCLSFTFSSWVSYLPPSLFLSQQNMATFELNLLSPQYVLLHDKNNLISIFVLFIMDIFFVWPVIQLLYLLHSVFQSHVEYELSCSFTGHIVRWEGGSQTTPCRLLHSLNVMRGPFCLLCRWCHAERKRRESCKRMTERNKNYLKTCMKA